MVMTGKQRCLAAIKGGPVDRVPVFPLLMAFAARRLGVSYRQYAAGGGTLADVLQATPEECSRKARACVRIAGGRPYMLSAGCEIPAEVSDEVFEAFCRSVAL